MNGDISPREKLKPSVIENHKKEVDRDRSSPRSDSSSHGSSSSVKHNKEVRFFKQAGNIGMASF